jgi:hypothetical protein
MAWVRQGRSCLSNGVAVLVVSCVAIAQPVFAEGGRSANEAEGRSVMVDAPKDDTGQAREPVLMVVPLNEVEGNKFTLPGSRLHRARVRIQGPSFITQYSVTTQRGNATVSTPDIVDGVTVLMVDAGAVSVEGTGWGRKVCAVRGQARIGVELKLDCGQ